MRALIVGGAALVAGLALASCGSSLACTVMGCTDAVSVALDPPLSEAGDYEIAITFDDQTVTCTATLPLEPGTDRCDGGDSPWFASLVIDRVAGTSLKGFWLDRAPENLSVTIRRDGVEIAARDLSPTYRKHQPNGPECDGDYNCLAATETLAIE